MKFLMLAGGIWNGQGLDGIYRMCSGKTILEKGNVIISSGKGKLILYQKIEDSLNELK